MADIFDSEKRSDIMRKVRSKNTSPEIIVRRFLHARGFRYRLHDAKLPGKPDIVLPKYKSLILIHGCFWHGHEDSECKLMRLPKSNVEYWSNKIQKNRLRDVKNLKNLKSAYWQVITVWECELKPSIRHATLIQVERKLRRRIPQ